MSNQPHLLRRQSNYYMQPTLSKYIVYAAQQ